jgi:hypothetical protein
LLIFGNVIDISNLLDNIEGYAVQQISILNNCVILLGFDPSPAMQDYVTPLVLGLARLL